ncbi:hypothetical protein LJK87_20100 [Paenibacillus sp. P25]|nr:hypothetical protein LJK87_20100 [Paenibacillus sp. P25]
MLRHHDGRGIPTMLTKLALEHFGLTEPEQLVSFVYGQENVRSALGEASRLVFAAAKEGDRAAAAIVEEAVAQLIRLALTAKKRLFPPERLPFPGIIPLVLSGGLFADNGFAERFLWHEDLLAGGLDPRRLNVPPAAGGLFAGIKAGRYSDNGQGQAADSRHGKREGRSS